MGQKVHPIGFRLGITTQHTSNWYAEKSQYTKNLLKDIEVRQHLEKKLSHASVSRIDIERTADNARVLIHTARPGIIIGKGGEEVEKLKKEFIEGVLNSGLNIVDIGVVPTPVNYFINYEKNEIDASVQITGSHNPSEYNGFKFTLQKDSFFGDKIKFTTINAQLRPNAIIRNKIIGK